MRRFLIFSAILFATFCTLPAKNGKNEVCSPDGRIAVTVDGGTYSVSYCGTAIISGAEAGLDLEGGTRVSLAGKVRRISAGKKPVTEHITAPLYRQKEFDFTYNTLRIEYAGGYGIEWIVSDEGAAYRFFKTGKGRTTVLGETADFNFAGDFTAWLPYSTNPKKPQAMAFQAGYKVQKLSEGSPTLAFLPATVDCGPVKVTIMESGLEAYPGMFVTAQEGKTTLSGSFAKYPESFGRYPYRSMTYVSGTEDFISVSEGPRNFPWRIIAIAADDTEMPVNNMVYALAEPSRVEDTSWIKPGFSAWEWWNDWQLTGVDFTSGINMDTYRHYIDFAAENGLEYMILDEGWYDSKGGDMMTPVAELDIPELVRYAGERNVGIILWGVFNVVDERLEEIFSHYADMGVAGFKIDFMDRDDQNAVEMIWRIAEAAARHRLVLDYHGIFKPTGLNRTFPNIINYEACFGQEESKWSTVEANHPLYNVTLPFIRMAAGYTDYTPGSMRNATKADFKPVYSNPMSMGTRAHTVALYITLDSPLTMLCDSPSLYRAEQQTTDFIASLPRIYDSEKVLSGRIGEHIVVARQAGDNWYVGGQTDWTPREIEVDFSFLGEGVYDVELFCDGVNASRIATDYRIEHFTVGRDQRKTIALASGGGFAMKILKTNN